MDIRASCPVTSINFVACPPKGFHTFGDSSWSLSEAGSPATAQCDLGITAHNFMAELQCLISRGGRPVKTAGWSAPTNASKLSNLLPIVPIKATILNYKFRIQSVHQATLQTRSHFPLSNHHFSIGSNSLFSATWI